MKVRDEVVWPIALVVMAVMFIVFVTVMFR